MENDYNLIIFIFLAKLKMMIMIRMIMMAEKMMMMMYCTIPAVPFSLDEDVDSTIVL